MARKAFRVSKSAALSLGGFTTLEVLVSTLLGSIIFTGLMMQYSASVTAARDHQIRIATQVQAQAIVQTIGAELRMLGNGVPFDQAYFQIGEDTLSDPSVTEPITVATPTSITVRLNETGEVYLLTQDFNPAMSSVVHLTDTTGLDANDPIYLSDSVVSGDDGLYATIAAVDHGANTITLNADVVASQSPNPEFPMGSICEEVPLVTYNSPEDGSGITRDSGFGPVLLGEDSTMSLEYLDYTGAAMELPLTNESVIGLLRSIRINVTITSRENLSSGEPYTTTVTQTVGIRNLNYLF